MYWEFFGFKEPPFALTPNPAFLFLSSAHQEAFAHLLFAIENRAGFIELSGEVGTGKTTIIRTLLNQLDPEVHRTALIFNPALSPLGLFREINTEFGLPATSSDLQELHQALNAFLLEENRADRTVVLVIDEAQNLAVEVLEQIRLISNLETERSKLIQIVLVGQPELRTLLSREELRQLDQRITVRYHLKPMNFADSCDYVRHRIRFAAGGGEPLAFAPGALKKIYRFSGGLPRLINSACDRALLLAYTRECRDISAAMAGECVAELRRGAPRAAGQWPQAAAALLAVALIAGAAWWGLSERIPAPEAKVAGPAVPSGAAGSASPVSADGVPAPARAAATGTTADADRKGAPLAPERAFQGLAAASEQDNLRDALNAVLAAWRVPPVDAGSLAAGGLPELARLRGMQATSVEGDLDALARLDAPALLPVTLPDGGKRLVALVGVGKEQVRVEPALAGRTTLTRAELVQIWKGGATVLWKDFHAISLRVRAAERVVAVRHLQEMLKDAGCYDGPLNGAPGRKTVEAVSEFQRREGLAVDGKAKGLTLLLLYRRAGGFFPPTLRMDSGGIASGAPAGSPVRAGGAA